MSFTKEFYGQIEDLSMKLGLLKHINLDVFKRFKNTVISKKEYDSVVRRSKKHFKNLDPISRVKMKTVENFISFVYSNYFGFKIRFRESVSTSTTILPVYILEEENPKIIYGSEGVCS